MLGREVGGGLTSFVATRMTARLEGLTDDEYLWEPAPGAWTIRPSPPDEAGTVAWHADLGPHGTPHTDESPPPVTTIAWRLWHIGGSPTAAWPPLDVGSGREFVEAWFSQPLQATIPAAPTAAEACTLVTARWAAAAELFGRFSDAEYAEPMGDIAGPFADSTLLGLVLHVADELIHHGAEISLLRDLYSRQAS